jgi:F-type H+-transporting ATPase subunit epsilon
MHLELITPEKKVFEQEVYETILPTASGQISVLPGHTPLITRLVPGVISVRLKKGDPDSSLDHLATAGGLAEITGNKIRILAEGAERAEDLQEMKIKQAEAAAREARKKARDDVSSANALAELEKSLAQLKVLELKKRRHRAR